MWRAGRMRLPRASPHRSQQLSLPPRISIGGGGHGQQPRQPGEVEPGGRVLPQGESGAAAASEGSGAGLRHTPRYYDTSHAPGIALDRCQDCCQRGNRCRTPSDRHRTAPQVNAELGQHWTARPVLRIRRSPSLGIALQQPYRTQDNTGKCRATQDGQQGHTTPKCQATSLAALLGPAHRHSGKEEVPGSSPGRPTQVT